MIKNIVFDLGRVLINYDPVKFLGTVVDEEKINKLYEITFLCDEWAMLDRGVISQSEVVDILSKRNLEYAEDIRNTYDNWFTMLTPIETTVKVLKQLKQKGYKLYYLSNYHQLAFEHIYEKYDFFKLFDGGVVSYNEKLLKPEEAIYKCLLDRYKLVPEECVFVDDTVDNIEACKKVNMNGIVFKDTEQFVSELKGLL